MLRCKCRCRADDSGPLECALLRRGPLAADRMLGVAQRIGLLDRGPRIALRQQHHAAGNALHVHFITVEAEFLRQANRLAATVLEELGRLHRLLPLVYTIWY